MALSFEESLKQQGELNKAKLKSAPVVMSVESAQAVLAITDLPYSTKYDRYMEYRDENFCTIDEGKKITLNQNQINLTQEENSQYVPFKMFRYYDGVDQLSMSLLMHAVTPSGNDAYASPVNVQYDSEHLYFGVIIPGAMCAQKGILEFEIQSIGVNEKGNPYKLITKREKFNIEESLSGNGMVEPDPDTGWLTTFLNQVTEKVSEAQIAANAAQDASTAAASAANRAQTVVNDAKTELSQTVTQTVQNSLLNYYTKTQVDNLLGNIDLTDVYEKIENIDGLANFDATFNNDTKTLSFLNGTALIKSVIIDTTPSSEWVTSYNTFVEGKISEATGVVKTELDGYKLTTDTDLKSIHDSIDGLPETLQTDYYNKIAIDEKLKEKASSSTVETLSNTVGVVEQTANTNKANISTLGNKLSDLEAAIGNIDTSPSKTYDATYDEEYTYTLWEIENEGNADEVRTPKSQFKIVGGSGGGSTSSILKIEYVTKSPLIVTLNDRAIIKYRFSGTDSSGDIVPEGYATWKIGNTVISKGIAINGENSFDATDYISIGSQKLTLVVTDDAGSLATKNWTVQKIDVRLESSFNEQMTYPIGDVSFDYTPYGAISKDVHFILDGTELPKVTTTSSGIPMAYTLPVQEHGSHFLETYITAEVNGSLIESNHIFKDILWYDPANENPVIGCNLNNIAAKQYDSTNIKYVVYDPKTETPTVTLAVDGNVVSTVVLDSHVQNWQFKSDTVGNHVLTITCGSITKTINVNVEKLDIDISPITANLVFDFNPSGYSNNDANRLWSDGDISMSVSDNFDWVNGGYHLDENGDQYFCVKAGTTAEINYNLFADDARKNGKEFKLVFKTLNVRKSNAQFLSCVQSGIGLQMNVHEAYVKSSVKDLYIPYSEEDIIEFEFNINKDTDIPIVMSYEDGTPYRPMSYTSDHSFTQSSPVPIVIGSEDCDVYIYRMKAYDASLTSRAILSNFIADARNATEMIDRYNRNQIYDENGQLTPDSVAKVRPDLKIIKLECPHFTNDKKDFVKGTSVEVIHKNGDAVLDNWKAVNCYHSGQGTTSNEYGAAGRNLDLLMCFDGTYQNSKITFDPDYKTVLTMGDGTVYGDGTGKVTLTRNSVPTNYLNVKVNIASSENENNHIMQERFNRYLPYKTLAQINDPKVKNSMEFVNCVVFLKENDPDLSTHREFQDTEWHFYAIGNVGDSKKTDYTRVSDPNDPKEFCVEIMDNTLPNSTFSGTPEALAALDADLFDEDGTYGLRYEMSGITSEDHDANLAIWRDFYRFVATSTDEDFVAHLGDWMVLDSALYIYLYTERYTMTDNRAKNTFYHYTKCEDGRYRFEFWNYDNDTSLGINNSGELTMTYGKEDIDYRVDGDPSSGYIFNAADSVLFRRIRNLFADQLAALFLKLESQNCWSSNSLITEFDTAQNEFCEELWRLDYERKYERTYRDGNTRFLESMMNGRKKYQRRQFERSQEKYMATKYFGTTATSDQIMFRCNTPVGAVVKPDYTLHLTPYSDMYLSVMFGATYRKQIRAKAGQKYDITCPFETMDDTAVLVYCASRIQSMGDVSACYIHDNDFSKAEKLQELIIGNTTEGYSNGFLTNLVIGNNVLLEKLDIRNTPNLSTSLNLSGCPNLEELYAEGSGLTGVVFANGGRIILAHLPSSLTSINLKNLMYLVDLNIAGYDKITTIVFENCDTVDCKDLLEKSPNVNRVRINNIDWTLEDDSLLERIYKMFGIDQNGYNTDNSVLSGKVYVPVIREQRLKEYQEMWSDLEITYGTLIEQFPVTFKNKDGSILEVQYVDMGSVPTDPVSRKDNPIPTPTMESTVSHDFTYVGWDNEFVSVFESMVYTAVYSESLREYTVRYLSKGIEKYSETAPYGSYVFYVGDTPSYSGEETGHRYNLFERWDKSGYVNGDKDINAVFDSFQYNPSALTGKDLSEMRPVEIYAIIKETGNVYSNYVSAGDSIKLQLGHDYNYDDIEEHVIIDKPTVFNGSNHIDTGLKLFDEDKSFVLAIDYQFASNSPSNSVLAQCFQTDGFSGMKLWNNSGINLSWGTSSETVSNVNNRDMLVLRHVKGEKGLHVYSSRLVASDQVYFELTRTRETITDATLVFGGAKADDGVFENHANGTIFWSKLWYTDLGDSACKELSLWTHEPIEMIMCQFRGYTVANATSTRSSMTFISKDLLSVRRHLTSVSNSNAGGWANCELNGYLNSRLYKSLPIQWQQLVKLVKVNSSVGQKSTEITSSNCYVYIPSAYEMDAGVNREPYYNEGSHLSIFSDYNSRIAKNPDGTVGSYWLRSPNVEYGSYFFRVETTGAINGYYDGYTEDGIRIMFSI